MMNKIIFALSFGFWLIVIVFNPAGNMVGSKDEQVDNGFAQIGEEQNSVIILL